MFEGRGKCIGLGETGLRALSSLEYSGSSGAECVVIDASGCAQALA